MVPLASTSLYSNIEYRNIAEFVVEKWDTRAARRATQENLLVAFPGCPVPAHVGARRLVHAFPLVLTDSRLDCFGVHPHADDLVPLLLVLLLGGPPGTVAAVVLLDDRLELHHPAVVHLGHLESDVLGGRLHKHRLSLLRDPVDVHAHEAADGVVIAAGQLDAEDIVHVLDRSDGAHRPAVLRKRDDLGAVLDALELVLLLFWIVDLPDDLFEHVLERHQASGAPVLVDADRDGALFELLQSAQERHRLRYEEGLLADRLHHIHASRVGAGVEEPDVLQQRLHAHHTDDLVKAVAVHGHAAELRLPPELVEPAEGLLCVYADHVDERSHHLLHRLAVQVPDAADHVALLPVQDAALHGRVKHEVELGL
mmetsp:Transcript_107300/g.280225  ORF Transcript_107300/g.280225 Transcript_107300/m.280225 type:complete len:368 (-) Transcript_107300:496-1599(-)